MKRWYRSFSPATSVFVLLLLCFGLLAGCTPRMAPPQLSPSPSVPQATQPPPSTATIQPIVADPTPTPTPNPSPTTIATTVAYQPCSPLEGVRLDALASPDLLKNPFDPPLPGWDDRHFGIDLAYWSDPEGKPMQGLPVYSSLTGVVAGVVKDREPYGNMLIIETPLDLLPEWVVARLPQPHVTPNQAIGLNCPPWEPLPQTKEHSLYLLYAHLQDPPEFQLSDPLTCGQGIGAVGTTGRSVNAHLHWEARIGPAHTRFGEMAHYENSVTDSERWNYCLWRVSGLFAPFDPLLLLDDAQATATP